MADPNDWINKDSGFLWETIRCNSYDFTVLINEFSLLLNLLLCNLLCYLFFLVKYGYFNAFSRASRKLKQQIFYSLFLWIHILSVLYSFTNNMRCCQNATSSRGNCSIIQSLQRNYHIDSWLGGRAPQFDNINNVHLNSQFASIHLHEISAVYDELTTHQ